MHTPDDVEKLDYRNSLFKHFRTQKTYENILREYNFTMKIFPTTHQLRHTSTFPIAAAHISLYTW